MVYTGFKKLKNKIKSEGKSEQSAGNIAAAIMRNKYKESDIKKHQKSGTSMRNVTPKKK